MRAQITLVLAVFLTFAARASHAEERATICAKPDGSQQMKPYVVEATIEKGSELNQKTRSFNFQGFRTYVVIFWSQEQVSIIQLEMPFLTYIEGDGTDQEGRNWKVWRSSGVCIG